MEQPNEKEIEKLISKKLKESDLLQNPRNIKTRIIVEMKMREMYLTGFNHSFEKLTDIEKKCNCDNCRIKRENNGKR